MENKVCYDTITEEIYSLSSAQLEDLQDLIKCTIDTLEKKGAVEGLRVIRIMTQGTCHIKLYEIR